MRIQPTPGILTRTLIYIPIIHSQVEMGAFRGLVRKATLQKSGEQAWNRKVRLIDKMWESIERVIDGLKLPYAKIRLYQDGLPVCGREAEIVADLAKAGSRNHRLLLRLMERGATIMGTESSPLLIEEYELNKQAFAQSRDPKSPRMEARQKTLGESLLKKRDQFIADRIHRTLRAGETGVLFLGMLHSAKEWLPQNIRVIYPVHHPISSRSESFKDDEFVNKAEYSDERPKSQS
jgi:hypothetical protein